MVVRPASSRFLAGGAGVLSFGDEVTSGRRVSVRSLRQRVHHPVLFGLVEVPQTWTQRTNRTTDPRFAPPPVSTRPLQAPPGSRPRRSGRPGGAPANGA